jgi:TonB family protein
MLNLCTEMFFLRALVIFTFTASVLGQTTSRHEAELDTLADRLTHEVQLLTRKHNYFPKVLVIGFLNQEGKVDTLGEHLADVLSDALVERLGPADVVGRKQFREHLLATGISPFDLQDNDVALWTAGKAGANLVVLGHVRTSEQTTTLTVELTRDSDAKKLTTASTDFSLAEETRSLLDKPVDWPASPDVVVPCMGSHRDAVVAAFRAAGTSEPKCTHCPPASYSDGARVAKYQGTVKLKIVVDEKGHVRSTRIIKGDSYGLEAQTLNTTKQWQFDPAIKDGKPVAVCLPIEMTFHLF